MPVNADTDEAEMEEPCADCGRETAHGVSVEMRRESQKRETAGFSREPYRVATCLLCGTEETTRMNNA